MGLWEKWMRTNEVIAITAMVLFSGVAITAVGHAAEVPTSVRVPDQSASPADISPATEQCIRNNAPAVEKAINSLPEAVEFLVDDLCAKPIAIEYWQRQKEIQAKMFQELRQRCAKFDSTKRGDEAIQATCATLDTTGDEASGWTIFAPLNSKPPAPTSLAAQILLELRTDHIHATHDQGSP